MAAAAGPTFRVSGTTANAVAPPRLPALENRPVAAEDAITINNRIPIVATAIAARPFVGDLADPVARQRALGCLTSAIYYEAGRESVEGQRAVAQVILNRVRHPAFPASICGVVYQGSTRRTGCQFTFTCDGSLARSPARDAWDRARQVAAQALAGSVYAPVGNSTHYHANYVLPYWASSLAKTAAVGAHLFYRWSGNWGQPRAFAQSYSGLESDPGTLRAAAMSAAGLTGLLSPDIVATAQPVPELDGVIALSEIDAQQVQAIFTLKSRKTVRNSDRKPDLVRVTGINTSPWTLSSRAPVKSETPNLEHKAQPNL